MINGGKIAEDGTYDEHISWDSLFAGLVARQRLDMETFAESGEETPD